MKLTTTTGTEVDIDPVEILRAAGVVYAARRRTLGGPPKKARPCRWCRVEVRGRAALLEHERECPARDEWKPVSDADLVPWTWTPSASDD